jgi:hypothetical protein
MPALTGKWWTDKFIIRDYLMQSCKGYVPTEMALHDIWIEECDRRAEELATVPEPTPEPLVGPPSDGGATGVSVPPSRRSFRSSRPRPGPAPAASQLPLAPCSVAGSHVAHGLPRRLELVEEGAIGRPAGSTAAASVARVAPALPRPR